MRRFVSHLFLGLTLAGPTLAHAAELDPTEVLKQCAQEAREPGYEIIRQTTYISTCFAGGDVYDVDVFKVAKCRGPRCDTVRLAAELIATASYVCDDLVEAECLLNTGVCPDIWLPVCGDDGITYGNSCEAECAGVHYTEGECGAVCPEIWAPVCGDDGVTYSNSCEAEYAGVRYFDGVCESAR